MPLISVIVALIILGVALYLINTVVPMEPWVKTVLNAVIVLAVVLWLLQAFLPMLHVPLR